MTHEELSEFKAKQFEFLKATVSEIMLLKSFRNDDGEYNDTVRNACLTFNQSYYSLKRTNLQEILAYRQEVAHIIIETKLLELLCEIVMKTHQDGWLNADGTKNENKYTPLYKTLIILINFSDASDEFAVAITCKYGFLEFIKKIPINNKERFLENAEPQMKDTEKQVLRMVLSIVHNMTMRETNIQRLRDCDIINVLRPYLKSTDGMCSMNVLASLAGIINEEECEIIRGNKDIVLFLLDIMKQAMMKENRRHKGWSAKESGFTIRLLARNDANKKLLVELGALELLVELGRTGNPDEQCESVQALWALSFDNDNAALITTKPDLGVVDLFVHLKQSEILQIKKACNGALWTLRDGLKKSVVDKYKDIGDKLSAEAQRHASALEASKKEVSITGHIMIYYQWDDQTVVKKVRDSLKAAGYKAEYAYQLCKTIIPLKMERGYTPDGWLGFILGAKLYFEFSAKYPFEKKMPALLKEIDTVSAAYDTGKSGSHTAGPETKSEKAPITHTTTSRTVDYPDARVAPSYSIADRPTVPMATILKVKQWTQKDVMDWIERTKLEGCGVDKLTGGEISLLAIMWNESTELIYNCLREMLNVKDLLKMSKIVWALQELS